MSETISRRKQDSSQTWGGATDLVVVGTATQLRTIQLATETDKNMKIASVCPTRFHTREGYIFVLLYTKMKSASCLDSLTGTLVGFFVWIVSIIHTEA